MSLKFEYRVVTHGVTKYNAYRRHDLDHRLNGPAELWSDGALYWCRYGKVGKTQPPRGKCNVLEA